MQTNSGTIPTGWEGVLDGHYAVRGGKTVWEPHCVRAPLRVQRSFYPEARISGSHEVCHNVAVHTAGGMVGGDRLSFRLALEPNARALLTTAAAGKIYRSNGFVARQHLHVRVATGACLEWLPQGNILFNGADFHQETRVELAPGAFWGGWEITRLGRSARGERFLEGDWRSRTEVWQQGRLLWCDRQWFPACEELLASPLGLAGRSVLASFAWIGCETSRDLTAQARDLWHTQDDLAAQIGVTRLTAGLLCRYRGNETRAARTWFVRVWHLLRLEFCQRPACCPRVWS